MRTLIKSGFFMITAGLLTLFFSVGTADAAKKSYNEPMDPALAKCQSDCMTSKQKGDHGAYESCMIKCNKDHKKNATPAMPKK
jgi:hypothetical protein